ncbi:MAG: cyclodeaminase/cyclohydrolase family protein [Faecousia sp.]
MDMTKESCRFFVEILASSAPTPGGGGAAALVGAIGAALCHMVGNLTVNKKQYAHVQRDIEILNAGCALLEEELLDQVQADAQSFLPLAAAYRLPKDTPGYDRFMDEAKLNACDVPLEIMSLCCRALDYIAIAAECGSKMAASDAGAAAVCCKAALQAASLTVFINTQTMTDRETAETIDSRVHEMLEAYGTLADRVYLDICNRFGQSKG